MTKDIFSDLERLVNEHYNRELGVKVQILCKINTRGSSTVEDITQDFLCHFYDPKNQNRRYKDLRRAIKYADWKEYKRTLFYTFKRFVEKQLDIHKRRHEILREGIVMEQDKEFVKYSTINIMYDLTEEEMIVVCWKIGRFTEQEAMEKIGCSRMTLFRRLKELRTKLSEK